MTCFIDELSIITLDKIYSLDNYQYKARSLILDWLRGIFYRGYMPEIEKKWLNC